MICIYLDDKLSSKLIMDGWSGIYEMDQDEMDDI